jgi:hypothetical protein
VDVIIGTPIETDGYSDKTVDALVARTRQVIQAELDAAGPREPARVPAISR